MSPAQPGIPSVSLRPSRVALYLSLVAGLNVAMGVATQVAKRQFDHDHLSGLAVLFDLDKEQTLPAFFTVFLLLLTSGLLGSIAAMAAKSGRGWTREWACLGVGFLCMSMDECVAIHERLNAPLRDYLGLAKNGPLSYAWIMPGTFAALLAGLLYLRFLGSLDRRHRLRFVCAGLIYLSGALGFEALGSWCKSVNGLESLSYAFLVVVEEGLEMAGLIYFIHALLLYVNEKTGELRYRFTP